MVSKVTCITQSLFKIFMKIFLRKFLFNVGTVFFTNGSSIKYLRSNVRGVVQLKVYLLVWRGGGVGT